MNKTELRTKYKLLRASLTEENVTDLSLAIVNNLLKMPIWEGTYYHLYLSIAEKREIDTSYILSVLHGKDKEIVVSKSDTEKGTLSHFLLTDNTRFTKNKWNIPEPVEGIEVPVPKIDVVFVPLLAFDEQGHRIGYGRGFYDRFLAECRPDTLKVGLSFFESEEEFEEIYASDVKLDYCVTPTRFYHF